MRRSSTHSATPRKWKRRPAQLKQQYLDCGCPVPYGDWLNAICTCCYRCPRHATAYHAQVAQLSQAIA